MELPPSDRTPAGLAHVLLAEADVLLVGESHALLMPHPIIGQMTLGPGLGLKLMDLATLDGRSG